MPNFEKDSNGAMLLDGSKIITDVIEDIYSGVDVGVVSAKFHNTLAKSMLEWAFAARDEYQINTVALAGGVFCNRYLTNRLICSLTDAGFNVLFKRNVPCNDGGIALGQAAIAVSNK